MQRFIALALTAVLLFLLLPSTPVTRKVVISKSSVTEDGFLSYNDNIYAAAARYDRLSREGAHIPATDEAVSPTHTEIDFTSGIHCAQCGLTIVQ